MRGFLIFFSLLLVISGSAQAVIDLDQYPITDTQKEYVRKLEKSGLSEAQLLKFIEAIIKHNNSSKKETLVPPHTFEQLMAVQRWAVGGAFFTFSQYTSYEFDIQKYQADCPSWELFNFGRHTGMAYLKADVMQSYFGYVHALTNHKTKHPENFSDKFFELAVSSGMDKYLVLKSK